MTANTGHQALPPALPREATLQQAWRRLSDSYNVMLRGGVNNVLDVTLTANAASTTVTDYRIGGNTRPVLQARTANAAAAVATTYVGTPTKNSVVITHANNAQTDRTFSMMLGG